MLNKLEEIMRKSWVSGLRGLTIFVLAIVLVMAVAACGEKTEGGGARTPAYRVCFRADDRNIHDRGGCGCNVRGTERRT